MGAGQNKGRIMGQMRCRTCGGTWSVSTKSAEAVITDNHAYLNPGHRVATVWSERREEAAAHAGIGKDSRKDVLADR